MVSSTTISWLKTQSLTGRGSFAAYLHKTGKYYDFLIACWYYELIDDAQHLLFVCDAWYSRKSYVRYFRSSGSIRHLKHWFRGVIWGKDRSIWIYPSLTFKINLGRQIYTNTGLDKKIIMTRPRYKSLNHYTSNNCNLTTNYRLFNMKYYLSIILWIVKVFGFFWCTLLFCL